MKISSQTIFPAALIVALAGCSGSDSIASRGITISPQEQASRNFAARAGGNVDAGGAIKRGETLTARSVSTTGQVLGYGGGKTNLADAKVAVSRNAAGELDLVVNGTRQSFTTQDRALSENGSAFGYHIADDQNNVFVDVANFTGGLDDLLDVGSGYAEALFVQTNRVPREDGRNVRAFAIVGTETRDAALAGLPSASYAGTSAIKMAPNSNFAGTTDEIEIQSRLGMRADFGAGTISGRLSNIRVSRVGGQPVDRAVKGTIALGETTFNTNGFAGGTVVPDATYKANAPVNIQAGSYSGAFYGPVANEVGGAISVTGKRNGEAINGVGYLHGRKN